MKKEVPKGFIPLSAFGIGGTARKEAMNPEQHLENADDLAIAAHHIDKIFWRCQKHFYKTSRLMRLLYKMVTGNLLGLMTQVQSELDTEYHKVATHDDFKKHGHIGMICCSTTSFASKSQWCTDCILCCSE